MTGEEYPLDKVFRDAKKHREISEIIARYLSNENDIRDLALNGIDLSRSKKILDLGCGFGFFTEALKGRVDPEARITGVDKYPEYEWFYFQSCDRAALRSSFLSNGIDVTGKMEDNSYDLILCSYAMYFFPGAIEEIARILKPGGHFIAITHAVPHMIEFTAYVRDLMAKNMISLPPELPYESLISKFSDKNGAELLNPFFSEISKLKYKGTLIFTEDDYTDLIRYFNFKHHFFIPEALDPADNLHQKIVESLKEDMKGKLEMRITKNDIIFICKAPRNSV